jgi:hypothetical protein
MTETIAVLTIITLAFAADLLLSIASDRKPSPNVDENGGILVPKPIADFLEARPAWMTINEVRRAEGLPPLEGEMPFA